jgi:uncharacterized delta-60 repeat protein
MRALALTAVVALSAPAAAGAPPGTLDESFGGDGRVETRVPGGRPGVAGIEALPGGKLLLAGTVGNRKVVLIRYRRDGTRDKRFGRKGVRSFVFDRDVVLNDSLLDAEGRLLVAGALGSYGSSDRAALVIRFDRAGRLDSSFDQDGIALTDFGGAAGETATGVAAQPDGWIVVGAAIDDSRTNDLGVARLDTSGRLDQAFGAGGLVRMAPHDGGDALSPTAIAAQPGGGIVIAANYASIKGTNAPFVIRLLASGAPDATFGQDPPGWRILTVVDEGSVSDLAVEGTRGRLFLTGGGFPREGGEFSMWLTEVGPAPAPSFPRGLIGVGGAQVSGERLAIDAAGRAIVVGSTFREEPRPSADHMLVARFDRNGEVNTCFGHGGLAHVSFRGRLSTAGAVTTRERRRIVVAGPHSTYPSERTASTFQLARLHNGRCPRR